MRRLFKVLLIASCVAPMAVALGANAQQSKQQQNQNKVQQQQDNAQQPSQAGAPLQTQGGQAIPQQQSSFHAPAESGLDRLRNVPVNRYDVIGAVQPPIKNPYATSKTAVMEGKKLFKALNCAGCHGPGGGGGMGPALSDTVWKYGDTPADIYLTIAHGRPGGMPAWGSALPPQAIWALVTYVKTLPRPMTGYNVETKLTGPAKKSPAKAKVPKKRPPQLPPAKSPKKPSNTKNPGDHG
ncbi:MAG TPA: c-type cytochrome [Gammaproteobacteria bacterium]|nr:c-type cytochrome [Gammaproteobacteria bacterium]